LQLEDVKDVLERFPIDSVREVNDLAQRIFAQLNSQGTPRLDDLHLTLERLRRTYLDTGSFQ
jgi:hypothetical protein